MLYSLTLSQFHNQESTKLPRGKCTYHVYPFAHNKALIAGSIFPSLTNLTWQRAAKLLNLLARFHVCKNGVTKRSARSDCIITLSIGRANSHAKSKPFKINNLFI
jgi:hypothetical protein